MCAGVGVPGQGAAQQSKPNLAAGQQNRARRSKLAQRAQPMQRQRTHAIKGSWQEGGASCQPRLSGSPAQHTTQHLPPAPWLFPNIKTKKKLLLPGEPA